MSSKGNVEELPSGSFRVRIRLNGRRRTIGTYPTRHEAERFLAAWNAEVREGAILAPSSVTLRSYGDGFLDRRETQGSALRTEVKSIASERSNWKHICAHPIADMAPISIRRVNVEEFAVWLRQREAVSPLRKGGEIILRPTGRPLSRQTQRHVLRLLQTVLDPLVGHSLKANPADRVRVALDPTSAPRDLSDDWLRHDEIEALLGCNEIPVALRTAYAAAIGLALRKNDLKAISIDHVKLDCDVPGPHVLVWISKTSKWHPVPVMAWLEPWLRQHMARLPKGAKWLFPNRRGERYANGYDFKWAQKTASRGGYESALSIAGVRRKLPLRDLRGTCATHLALGTWGRQWSMHEVKMMLGHSDEKVTERYVRRAIDFLAVAAAETLGGPAHVGPRGPGNQNAQTVEITSERATGFEPATFSLGS